jgi:membrane-associated phospholipid phosphatase
VISNLATCGVCAATIVSLASGAVTGAEQQTLDAGWPAGWNRIGPLETGVVGGLGISLIALEFVVKAPDNPRWNSGILFDDDARSALRAGSPGGRSRAATASDFAYAGLPLYAIAVEAGLVTWLGKGQGDAALQLALINGEALIINGLLTRIAEKTIGRARPDGSDNAAFPSGHTSTAFTVAAGLCVQHARLQIYGGLADKLVCPGALTVATATGLLRIVSDRHWASDVVAGAVLGSLVGATVSWAHLRDGDHAAASSLSLGPGARSLVYGGRF